MLGKSLGKESLIYGVGHIITRSITFLLLPIYTNAFSLEDYGILSLIYTFLGFMNVILHYGLDASLLKHYVPADQEDKKSILTNTYASFMVTTIVFIITILIISREIFIMSLREWMANSSNGKTLEVSSLGKTKTILQMTGISMVIATPIIPLSYYFELSIVVLIIGTLFGYFSAFKYFKESFSKTKLFI